MKIVVDPVTRIEGHLRIQAQVTDGKVTEAWSTSPMYRGIEQVLIGRDPRDAWVFTQRICGVCTTVSALASVRAVESALGIRIPDNARILRNVMAAAQHVHDHLVHFYHLHGPDWFDVTGCADADPAEAAALQRSLSEWPENTVEHFTEVKKRVTEFLGSGQLGMFADGYAGHPAHRLTPHGDLLFMDHYLQALAWQRDAVRIHAVLGGKNPHPQTYLVGGMSTPLDPSSPAAVTPEVLDGLRALTRRMRTFVEQVYLPDVLYLARQYPEWTRIGRGVGNLMSCGDFPQADGTLLVPAGILRSGGTSVEELDEQRITEDVSRAWYARAEPARPATATTVPAYTGPTPPWTDLDTDGAYSWGKAPRYGGQVMEVGPLARIAIARAGGVARVVELVDGALPSLGGDLEALRSTLGRMTARALETLWFVERLDAWLAELSDNITSGDLRIADPAGLDRASWPARASGYGLTEAPRGALGHWVRIADGELTGYQIVIPSTWNGSPRDGQGQRGAWEQALLGVPVADGDRPLEVLRLLHSFDPCMACAVHVVDPEGTRLADVTVVP